MLPGTPNGNFNFETGPMEANDARYRTRSHALDGILISALVEAGLLLISGT